MDIFKPSQRVGIQMEELMLAECTVLCLTQNAVPDLGHLLIFSAFLAVTPDYQAEDVAVYS